MILSAPQDPQLLHLLFLDSTNPVVAAGSPCKDK